MFNSVVYRAMFSLDEHVWPTLSSSVQHYKQPFMDQPRLEAFPASESGEGQRLLTTRRTTSRGRHNRRGRPHAQGLNPQFRLSSCSSSPIQPPTADQKDPPSTVSDQMDASPPVSDQMDDFVFRTLLRAIPSSAIGRQLLRSLHPVSSAGRLAALRTTIILHLDRAQQLGVPYSRQASVLAAADRASRIRMNSGQIGGLLQALLTEQQQQQQQQQALPAEWQQQRHQRRHQRRQQQWQQQQQEEEEVVAPQLTKIQQPTIKVQRPHNLWVSVAGKLPQQGVRQLVQLLDVLPGSQHLERLSLRDLDDDSLWGQGGVVAAAPQLPDLQALRIAGGPLGGQRSSGVKGAGSNTVNGGGGTSSAGNGMRCSSSEGASGGDGDGRSCSSSVSGGSTHGAGQQQHTEGLEGSSGSWRHSCSRLDVTQRPSNHQAHLSDLCPLLEALPQLRTLWLDHICVNDLPQCVGLLGSVRELQLFGQCVLSWEGWPGGLPGWEDTVGAGPTAQTLVLEGLADMTQLQKLSLVMCTPGGPAWGAQQQLRLPQSCSNLRQLRSLDVSHTNMHSSFLALLPEMGVLEELNISGSVQDAAALTSTLPRLTGLTGLVMRPSPISSLPQGMAACSRLRKLDWSCDAAMAASSPRLQLDVVWRLSALESLFLADDTLTALPVGIRQLTRLTKLDFSARSISQPPFHLSSLVNLRELVMDLSYVPAVLQAVTTLTQLARVGMYTGDLVMAPEVEAFVDAGGR